MEEERETEGGPEEEGGCGWRHQLAGQGLYEGGGGGCCVCDGVWWSLLMVVEVIVIVVVVVVE